MEQNRCSGVAEMDYSSGNRLLIVRLDESTVFLGQGSDDSGRSLGNVRYHTGIQVRAEWMRVVLQIAVRRGPLVSGLMVASTVLADVVSMNAMNEMNESSRRRKKRGTSAGGVKHTDA